MRKPNTTITRQALATLVQTGPTTRKGLAISTYYLNKLREEGLVTEVGVQPHTDESGKVVRGRPNKLFKATDKGRKRGKRFIQSTQKTA